jgi:hypothetical protein
MHRLPRDSKAQLPEKQGASTLFSLELRRIGGFVRIVSTEVFRGSVIMAANESRCEM